MFYLIKVILVLSFSSLNSNINYSENDPNLEVSSANALSSLDRLSFSLFRHCLAVCEDQCNVFLSFPVFIETKVDSFHAHLTPFCEEDCIPVVTKQEQKSSIAITRSFDLCVR